MKKGINYWAFNNESEGYPKDPIQALKEAREIGFDCFELTVEEQGLISLSTSQGDAEKVRKEADILGIKLNTLASGLAWGASPTHPDSEVREKALKNNFRIIEIASWLGVETILYLPGMVSAIFMPDFPPQPYDLVDKRARESLKRVLPEAEKSGVKIGVENVWSRYLLSPLEMRDFIDSFESPFVGSYFDVGNVMLYGHPEHWITILGDKIFAIHLKDFCVNVGNLDGFVDLLSGDVDYPGVMESCNKIGYDGPFTAEIVPGRPGCVEKAFASMKIIEKMREEKKDD